MDSLPTDPETCSVSLSTEKAGVFFYDHQCTCQEDFDRTKPYTKDEQHCYTDLDCCTVSHGTTCSDNGEGQKVCVPLPASEDFPGVINDENYNNQTEWVPSGGVIKHERLQTLDVNAPIDLDQSKIVLQVGGLVDDQGYLQKSDGTFTLVTEPGSDGRGVVTVKTAAIELPARDYVNVEVVNGKQRLTATFIDINTLSRYWGWLDFKYTWHIVYRQ
jgi:hypothetical protein